MKDNQNPNKNNQPGQRDDKTNPNRGKDEKGQGQDPRDSNPGEER